MSRFTIRGWIVLSSPQAFKDATAIVGLDDVTKIDAPATRIAEVVITSINGLQQRLSFCLSVKESALIGDSFVLSAEIRRSDKTKLHRGDFLTTTALPWHPDDFRDQVVTVHQI